MPLNGCVATMGDSGTLSRAKSLILTKQELPCYFADSNRVLCVEEPIIVISTFINAEEFIRNYGPIEEQTHLKQVRFARSRLTDSFQAAPDVSDVATMAEEVPVGLPREIGGSVGPHMDSDPYGLPLRAPTSLGNYIARGLHCRLANTLHAGNPSVLKVGDSAKAQKVAGESGFLAVFLMKTEAAADFILTRVLRAVSDQICGRREP